MIKPLLLSTYDLSGGAARAAYRLHQGLRGIGVESYMLVQSKVSDDRTVIAPSNELEKVINKSRWYLDRLPLELHKKREHVSYSVQWVRNPKNIRRTITELNPDIINLHWICDAYFSIKDIGRLDRPVVWSLHDMWPFTGGCHYDQGCGRYTEECGVCPQLHSDKKADLSRWIWRLKRKAWRNTDLTIVALSQWLADCARKSSLFKDLRIEVIHNGLDVDRFKPVNKQMARQILNLPMDRQLILFGAMNATSDPRKGFAFLKSALNYLRASVEPDKIDIVIVGASEPNQPTDLGFKAHYLGTLRDEISLSLIYSAADAFVAPSKQDNLPNTVMEALACGTPCVAFNIGGMPDMIEHRQNGYLAKAFDSADLAWGIGWVLDDTRRYQELSRNARVKAVHEFDQILQAQRYVSLYSEILADGGR